MVFKAAKTQNTNQVETLVLQSLRPKQQDQKVFLKMLTVKENLAFVLKHLNAIIYQCKCR